MPRQLQFQAPGHGKLPNNPNNKLAVDPLSFLGGDEWLTMTEAILFGAANTMLQIIDDTTGLDLLPAAKMLEDIFGSALSGPGMPNFLSYLGNQPATDPVTGLATPSTNPVGLFTGLLSWVTGGFGILTAGPTLLEQLISAGGGTVSGGGLLGDFGMLFGGLGPLTQVFGGFTSGVPILSQLISAGGGTGSSLSEFGNLFAALGMTAEQIAQDIFGVSGGNLPLLGGNLMSLLGNPNLNVPTGFDPQSIWNSIITDFINPSGLISTVMDWGALGLSMFGLSGITNQSGFGSAAGNMLSMLGNPLLGSGFDPIAAGSSMLQNVLTPAGALSTYTQLPGHLFGVLAPGNLTNMLPDPGFTDPAHFDDPTMWDGTVGRTTPLGSLKFTANGSYQQYVGVPIGSDATQVTNVGIYAFWQGLVVASGQAINLAVEAFDSSNPPVLIPNPAGRVVMSITNPTANSVDYLGDAATQPPIPAAGTAGWDGVSVPDWVYLSGPYRPPAGTSYIAISPEITDKTISGATHFDDGYMMPDQGLVDSSILSNFQNLLDGSIPGTKIAGLQGIEDMESAFQSHVDGLFNAMNDGPTQSGVPFFSLFNMMQQTALSAMNAQTLASTNTNVVGNKVNKPAITGGTQPSGEANFTHATMPDTTTLPLATLASGQAMAGWIRVGQSASKGFVDFLAAKAATGTTGIFMNLLKQNITTGVKTNVYASPDISSVIPASTTIIPGVSQMLIPGGVNVGPNDVLWGEIVNLSGSNLLVGKRSTPIPDHFNTYPRNIGHTRTVATLGTSPATLNPADAATSQTAPILNFGIANVPADYHLPQQDVFPPTGSGAGTYPYTIPSFITTGDLLDLIVVGGGGSGMSEWDAGIMAGGLGGSWAAQQFVYGSDIHGTGLPVIPAGTTTLNCVVGAGGPHPGGYWSNGNPGSNSQWWAGPVGTGTLLVDAAGGAGGSGSVGLSNGTGSGPSPNPYIFDAKSYFGGNSVGINATGNPPGGGGGGATWYELGGSGARGGGWAYAQKAVT